MKTYDLVPATRSGTGPLAVTVGTERGDFRGRDDRAIQAAIDYVAALGGGTVRVLAGLYELRNAVHLRSGIALVGEGDSTVLRKCASATTTLISDTDWYDTFVDVADPVAFPPGVGVFLQSRDPQAKKKATVVGRDGHRLWLDRQPRENFWADNEATISTLFPLVTGDFIHDVTVADVALDGNRVENDLMDGNYGGCIFLQDCERATIARVYAHDYHGDGISFQVAHDATVEECRSIDHADLGLHPGSGSQRPRIRRNRIVRNRLGLFFCWGVQHGVAEENEIADSRDFGVSIGHRDTDNLVRRNTIRGSGKVGILFRAETSDCRCPHRNTIDDNLIDGFGTAESPGIGIDVNGVTRDLTIRHNRIVGHPGRAAAGIRIGPAAGHMVIEGNEIIGVGCQVEDRRS